VPAYPLEHIVDPTGAGDTFAGGFVGYLATSPDYNDFKELKKAMIYGTVVASFTVEGFGSEGIINVTMDNVQRRYDELMSMIKTD
jgi:sugar/nucleoside kinase (ribokinase family)